MDRYFRRVVLRAHFGAENEQNNRQQQKPDGLKPTTNSSWLPNKIHHTVQTYIEAVKNDLTKEPPTNQSRSNLSKEERRAMEDLSKREDIIISKADKGGAVVIQEVDDYVAEANRQLGDSEYYKQIDHDLTPEHTTTVNSAVDKLASEELISRKTAKALHAHEPRTPKFYMLPKVHKKNHPGHPIIAAVNSPTTNLARYVDHHLQPLAANLPSFVKDTGDFLRKIEKTKKVRPNSILVTMDVSSLYTSIPHKEGLTAVAHALEARPNPTISTRVILKLLYLVLHLNNFCFNDKHYLQIKGCAMGAKCSGSYADLFMGRFEGQHIFPKIDNRHHMYTRFKDDIFLVWTDGKANLLKFFDEINGVHPSIKFECQYSQQKINFLDTYVHIDQSGNLRTSLYTKPTDRNAYLHHESYHHPKQIANIPYGQFLRVKKICSTEEDTNQAMERIEKKFLERGFPKSLTETQRRRAEESNRMDLLTEKEKQRNARTPFTTTYNHHHPPIQQIINAHWPILQTSKRTATALTDPPVVAYRRNKNLRDILGQTHLSRGKKIVKSTKPDRYTGSRACLTSTKNQCCRHVQSTKTFSSDNTGETLRILHNLNCRSQNIIYSFTWAIVLYVQELNTSENRNHQRSSGLTLTAATLPGP